MAWSVPRGMLPACRSIAGCETSTRKKTRPLLVLIGTGSSIGREFSMTSGHPTVQGTRTILRHTPGTRPSAARTTIRLGPQMLLLGTDSASPPTAVMHGYRSECCTRSTVAGVVGFGPTGVGPRVADTAWTGRHSLAAAAAGSAITVPIARGVVQANALAVPVRCVPFPLVRVLPP